jgi:hypothetical protein
MHIAEALCTWLQSLASHSPNKNPHPNDGFGGNLMKKNFKSLQHFNQKFTQREPESCLHEALVYNHFISFGCMGSVITSSPQNRNIAEISFPFIALI